MTKASSAAEPLKGRTIILGIGGGIAAYKSVEILRLLRKAGADVYVVMTAAAQRFITPLTLQTLSSHPVGTDLFDLTQESQIGHISLGDRADLLLIAPATADLLGRLSLGLGDDLLTTLSLACTAPLLLAPAMNVNMWQKPPVQEHVARLLARGVELCGPEPGDLACGWVGPGRMAEPAAIAQRVEQILGLGSPALAPAAQLLRGRRVLVTAGPTHEALDPVRFIGNRSSGKMGFALAQAAAGGGADVTLVAGPVALPTPPGVRRVDVKSAADMAEAVLPVMAHFDVIVMTAAVADFRPATLAPQKLKKAALGENPRIELVRTVDILAELGQKRGRGKKPLLIGFAAETHAVEEYAQRKLLEKRCDVIVANDVAEAGSGFGTATNRVTLFFAPTPTSTGRAKKSNAPRVERLPLLPKLEVAYRLWEKFATLLS